MASVRIEDYRNPEAWITAISALDSTEIYRAAAVAGHVRAPMYDHVEEVNKVKTLLLSMRSAPLSTRG